MSHSRRLAESPHYAIEHEFETVRVVHKKSGTERELGSHYGDPCAAVIAPDESWFAAGGEGITFLHSELGYREFLRGEQLATMDPVRITHENPRTGAAEVLETVQRSFEPPVRVCELRALSADRLEITIEENGERWVLLVPSLTLQRIV
jgi:hypothetical protein